MTHSVDRPRPLRTGPAAPVQRHAPVRNPDAWLAVLRIVVGLWFLKSLATKVVWTWAGGVFPVPTASARWMNFMPIRLREWAESNPIGWYREFLLEVAIPQNVLFGNLTAFAEVAVGLGLTLGLLTPYASLLGLLLMSQYVLASAGVNFNQQGFHILLIACLVAFFAARAGRRWGVDGWLARRFPQTFGRIPLL